MMPDRPALRCPLDSEHQLKRIAPSWYTYRRFALKGIGLEFVTSRSWSVAIMRCRYARCETNYCEATLFCQSLANDDVLCINESTNMVDGIGGTTWEGALILYEYLAALIESGNSGMRLLELGAGTGICGLLCASHEKVGALVLTDREIDLCESNVALMLADETGATAVAGTDISSLAIEWTEEAESFGMEGKSFDIIFGAEIVCLVKQQSKLISTMHQLVGSHGPATRIFFTFDDLPPPFSQCNYEAKFNNEICEKYGYKSVIVCSGCCRWTVDGSSTCGGEFCHDSSCIRCVSVPDKISARVSSGAMDKQSSGEGYSKVAFGSCNLVYHVDPRHLVSEPPKTPRRIFSLPDFAASDVLSEKRALLRALLNVSTEGDEAGDASVATTMTDQLNCAMLHHVVMYYRD